MKIVRKLSAFLFLMLAVCFFAPKAKAQCSSYTTVTGTVTDPNGIPYAGATLHVDISGTVGPSMSCTGAYVSSYTLLPNELHYTLTLDKTGSFSISLPPNSIISTASTNWVFSVSVISQQPIGTGPISFSYPATITGSSQSLSGSLSALAPALSNVASVNTASVPCPSGILVGSNCIQGHFDTQQDVTCTFNATTTITCSDAPFVASDADGKHHISAYLTCQTNHNSYVSEFGTTAVTITAFVSASQITVSHATSGSVSGTGCIYKGTPDSAAFAAADAAMAASKPCPAAILPAAKAWLTHGDGGHLSTDPNSCAINPSISGFSYYGGGMAVIGQGTGVSEIFYDNTIQSSDLPLMTAPFDALWQNWSATGGGNSMNGVSIATGSMLFKLGTYAEMVNWKCTNLGQQASGVNLPNGVGVGPAGVEFNDDVSFGYVNDGCGVTGTYSAGASGSVFYSPSLQDSGVQLGIQAGRGASMYQAAILGTPLYPTYSLVANYGGSLNLHGASVGLNGATSSPGLQCWTAGCTFSLDQGAAVNVAGSTGLGIDDNGFATTVYLNGASITGGASGDSLHGTSASSVLYSQNITNSFTGPISWAGKIFTSAPQQSTCSMVSATTCTLSLTSISTNPSCTATDTTNGTIASKCFDSSGTITVTAPASNSDTWAVTLY